MAGDCAPLDLGPLGRSTFQLNLAERARRADVVSNLQIEIALTRLALKIVVAAIAPTGRPQTSDHFVVYPATGALEIASPYRDEAAETRQRVVRSMKASF
jgi:hypothetical protein